MGARNEVLGHWAELISTDWEQIRSWPQGVFTGQWIAAVALLSSTIAVLAAVLFSLSKAVQGHAIVGATPYLSSLKWQLPIPGY